MSGKRGRTTIQAAILSCMFLISFLIASWAEAATMASLEQAKFDVSSSLQDNLKSLVGKDIYVQLRSGKTYQGHLKAVGNSVIHIERLAGKEFFDALIRIDDVTAIEIRFREMK